VTVWTTLSKQTEKMVCVRGQKVLTWGVMCMGIVSGSMHCLEKAASLFGSGAQAKRSLMQTRTNSLQLRLDDIVIHNAFKNLSSGNESMGRDEFASGLQKLALGIHPFEIRDIFLEMDQNNDGKITRKVLSWYIILYPSLKSLVQTLFNVCKRRIFRARHSDSA
jgi:hypothetical protein